jgi:phosphoribosylamine--glycine ligase
MNVSASGKTVSEPQKRADENRRSHPMARSFCRRDIGWQAVEQKKSVV